MCGKCSGNGKQYREVFPGAWQLVLCSCIEYNEEEWRAELIEIIEKVETA